MYSIYQCTQIKKKTSHAILKTDTPEIESDSDSDYYVYH